MLIAAAGGALGAVVAVAAGTDHIALTVAFYAPMILIVTALARARAGLLAGALAFAATWYAAPGQPVILLAMAAAGAVVLTATGFLRDIYDETRRAHSQLDALIEGAGSVVFAVDQAGHIRGRHDRLQELTGLEWPGYGAAPWTGAVHEEDRDTLPSYPLPQGERAHQAELRLLDPRKKDYRWYRLHAVPVEDHRGHWEGWACKLRDIHESKLAKQQREVLLGELRHRLKNLVAVIEALAKSSRRPDEPGVEDFLTRFIGRLRALGAAGDIVLAGNRRVIDAGALIRATLHPFIDQADTRITIDGPRLNLSEETGGSLALAVHELATNAIKYGALSRPEGRVSLTWTCTPTDEGEKVRFEWKERGGPPPPNEAPREGYGTRVISFAAAREKDGNVTLEFQPGGLCCTIAYTKMMPQP